MISCYQVTSCYHAVVKIWAEALWSDCDQIVIRLRSCCDLAVINLWSKTVINFDWHVIRLWSETVIRLWLGCDQVMIRDCEHNVIRLWSGSDQAVISWWSGSVIGWWSGSDKTLIKLWAETVIRLWSNCDQRLWSATEIKDCDNFWLGYDQAVIITSDHFMMRQWFETVYSM